MTLIELLVALAILAILLAAGVPSMAQFLRKQAVVSHVDTFGSAVRLARSESLKRGVKVQLCVSSDPEASTPVCATDVPATGWATGWLMTTVDKDSNADEVLKIQQPLTSSGGVTTEALSIMFWPNGVAIAEDASFTFKGSSGTDADKSVCVSAQGRIKPGGTCS